MTRPVTHARQPRSASPRPPRGGRRSRRAGRGFGPRSRLVIRVLAALLATFLLVTGWSIGHALTVPGGGTLSERIAEWARNHYLGPAVTFGEWLTYQAPKKGGKPDVSFKKLGGQAVHKKKHYHGIVPIIPANIGSPAGAAARRGHLEGRRQRQGRARGVQDLRAAEQDVLVAVRGHRLDGPAAAEVLAAAGYRGPRLRPLGRPDGRAAPGTGPAWWRPSTAASASPRPAAASTSTAITTARW